MSPVPMDNIKVLLIDDEDDFLNQARDYFKDVEEIDFDTEISAKKGLELIEKGDYDAVIADYKMPEMDGLDILEKVRGEGNDIPFILLTGKGEEEVAMKALNKGADRYHIKILDPNKQFGDITQSVVEEVVRKKSETELRTLQTWIKNTLSKD